MYAQDICRALSKEGNKDRGLMVAGYTSGEMAAALSAIVNDAERASTIIARIRALSKKAYLFSVEHTARRLWSLDFESVARSSQKSIAQGLPRVDPPPELALKGPPGTAKPSPNP